MRCARRSTESDAGSASLEFLTVGLLLLIPLVYLVLAVASLQGAALAVEGAARHAARVFVQQGSVDEAEAAAERAISVTLADYGVSADAATVAIICEPRPDDCLTRRGFVTVRVDAVAALPLMPALPGLDVPAGVTMSASSTAHVSRFRVDR